MVAFATQVKRRRGTQEQNDAFTGAEGEIVVDLTNMTLRVHDGRTRGGFVVGGGAGRNIGDIFFTARTDTSLNGAVEANGGQYNTTDFVGSESIGNILSAGKVPYMTIADFDTAVANNGECTSFGWDGGTVFKVPKINGRRLIRRQLPTADNNYTWYNLYSDGYVEQGGIVDAKQTPIVFPIEMSDTNYAYSLSAQSFGASNYDPCISNVFPDTLATTGFTIINQNHSSVEYARVTSWQVNGYAAESEYNDKSTWQYDRYMRPMVQLANGVTSEAVIVAGNVLADISDIRQQIDALDVVIESQLPTADNGYTWYRKYKSGWVEQGGVSSVGPSTSDTITLPIEMSDTNYTLMSGLKRTTNSGSGHSSVGGTPVSTTQIKLIGDYNDSGTGSMQGAYWQVIGMAAQ